MHWGNYIIRILIGVFHSDIYSYELQFSSVSITVQSPLAGSSQKVVRGESGDIRMAI